MATYVGFSTQQVDQVRRQVMPGVDASDGLTPKASLPAKKYRLTDEQLVIADFLNSLNIPQGQRVGKPEFGTTLWSFVFEPNTNDVRSLIEDEIRRMAEMDGRLIINTVEAFPQDNGILLEVELAVVPFNNATTLSIMLDQATTRAFNS
jgi:phage baseplate assembly protein W